MLGHMPQFKFTFDCQEGMVQVGSAKLQTVSKEWIGLTYNDFAWNRMMTFTAQIVSFLRQNKFYDEISLHLDLNRSGQKV